MSAQEDQPRREGPRRIFPSFYPISMGGFVARAPTTSDLPLLSHPGALSLLQEVSPGWSPWAQVALLSHFPSQGFVSIKTQVLDQTQELRRSVQPQTCTKTRHFGSRREHQFLGQPLINAPALKSRKT